MTLAMSWGPVSAAPFSFSTGAPDGKIATASRPGAAGVLETETADDFVIGAGVSITGGSFTGLFPTGLGLSGLSGVEIEFYRVFPFDSVTPPSGHVPTRVNSPSDNAIASLDSGAGDLSFTATLLNPSFTAANSVVNGINPSPGQFTGGEGAVSGEEVVINFTFTTPLVLSAGHYFFRPEAGLTSGSFLWLSAPKPIVAPGTPFTPDLQSWIRNASLSPDWLRIGTDITHQGPFNAAFSLIGATAPEPATWAMMLAGFGMVGATLRRRPARSATT